MKKVLCVIIIALLGCNGSPSGFPARIMLPEDDSRNVYELKETDSIRITETYQWENPNYIRLFREIDNTVLESKIGSWEAGYKARSGKVYMIEDGEKASKDGNVYLGGPIERGIRWDRRLAMLRVDKIIGQECEWTHINREEASRSCNGEEICAGDLVASVVCTAVTEDGSYRTIEKYASRCGLVARAVELIDSEGARRTISEMKLIERQYLNTRAKNTKMTDGIRMCLQNASFE